MHFAVIAVVLDAHGEGHPDDAPLPFVQLFLPAVAVVVITPFALVWAAVLRRYSVWAQRQLATGNAHKVHVTSALWSAVVVLSNGIRTQLRPVGAPCQIAAVLCTAVAARSEAR